MSTFAMMKDTADSPELVRRALQGVGFLAPATEPIPSTLLDTDGSLKALTANWWPIGVMGTDGFVFSANIDKVDTEAWGYSAPVRSDITKAPKQIKVTPLERYRRQILELSMGLDLSAVAATKTTTINEVKFDEPALPASNEYRFFCLFMDGTPSNPFYRAKAFTLVKLADLGDEKWSTDDDATGQEITLDVLNGAEGFPVRHYMGGKAFDPVKYGFLAASA